MGSWTALHTVHTGKLSPRKRKGFSQGGHKELQVIIPFLVEVGKLLSGYNGKGEWETKGCSQDGAETRAQVSNSPCDIMQVP